MLRSTFLYQANEGGGMSKVSGRQAAINYLREHDGGPLPVREVTAEAAKRAHLKGKTPSATVAAECL